MMMNQVGWSWVDYELRTAIVHAGRLGHAGRGGVG